MRIPFQLSLIASAVVLAGCGGGGGGPSGTVDTGTGYIRSSVSYTTPTQINSYTPMQGTGVNAVVSDVFTKDLNNDNVDEVVVGGRLTQPATAATWRNTNIQLYGWNTGSFSNETSTWFSGNDNEIIGTEPSIKFGDFDGDGNIDMFTAPSTDMSALYGKAVVFRNSGSDSFTRSEIATGNAWSHDSWVGDLNGDGRDDIVMSNIGGTHNISVNYGNADGTFDTHTGGTTGGSGISIADYLGDGTKTVILTDASSSVTSDTKLYSISAVGGSVTLTEIATLPESRFHLAKHATSLATAGTAPHGIRNFTLDFNNDGLMDVVVIDNLSGNDINMSEMQFLRNNGAGSFTDVTDDVLVDYDTDIQASYQPILIDVNNDGLDDILLSASDDITESGYHDSTRVLIQTSDGKFVQKYENVFKDFYNQIHSGVTDALDWGQPINIVQGPNNEKYLFSTVMYEDSGNVKAHTFLAKIGSTGTVTPQAVADVINANWPYLSAPEVNEVLANTSPLSINGVQVVDLQSALNPVGELTINTFSISGNLIAPGLDSSLFTGIQSFDSLGRNYIVDLDPLVSDKLNNYNFTNSLDETGVYATGDNRAYNIGYTSEGTLQYSLKHTYAREYSPWLNMNGMFGTVTDSSTTDLGLIAKKQNNWAKIGFTRTNTNINPGLVSSVSSIDALYAVGGTRFTNGIELLMGVKPYIVNGSMNLNIPDRVDNSGNVLYSNKTIDLNNQIEKFYQLNYSADLGYNAKFKINTQFDHNGNNTAKVALEMPF